MPIHHLANSWILETEHTAYAFGLDADGTAGELLLGRAAAQPI